MFLQLALGEQPVDEHVLCVNEVQVGQHGTDQCVDVRKIYLSPFSAVGISGAPQYQAVINPATCIVAINKDPAAEIFKVASVGVLGDWEQVLPELLRVGRAVS